MASIDETERIAAFKEALLSLDRLKARALIQQALAAASTFQMTEKLIVPALEQIGAGWQSGEVALSQVYMSGRICEELVDAMLPRNGTAPLRQPEMAIAVLEDYHMLGKRIVYSILRASGYRVRDYGRMEVDPLAAAVQKDQIEILLISTLMLRSALKIKDLRARLTALDSRAKIVVGGAPFRFDPQLWQEVGADAGGREGAEAVAIVARMIGGAS